MSRNPQIIHEKASPRILFQIRQQNLRRRLILNLLLLPHHLTSPVIFPLASTLFSSQTRIEPILLNNMSVLSDKGFERDVREDITQGKSKAASGRKEACTAVRLSASLQMNPKMIGTINPSARHR